MTIDEAIEYHIKAATQRAIADEEKGNYEKWNETKFMTKKESEQIIADNQQLAKWLTELKELKNSVGAVKLELLKEAQAELEKRGNMLHDAIAELEEAKRLLKAAVEDFTAIAEVRATATPILCPKYYEAYMKAIDVRTRKWRYADEALKLIES